MRRMYPGSPEYGKLGFEKRLLRTLVQLDEENMRRIRKNKDKLSGMDDNGRVGRFSVKQTVSSMFISASSKKKSDKFNRRLRRLKRT